MGVLTTWSYYKKAVEMDMKPVISYKYKYYGYKAGEVFEYDTIAERDKAHKEKMFGGMDKKILNKEEVDAIYAHNQYLENLALSNWKNDLKERHSKLVSLGIFDICYEQAHATAHSEGWDAIANEMWDVEEFAISVIETVRAAK